MAAIDTWVLDGVDLTATNFSMMEFTADPPKAKPEWITGADSEWSALSRQPKHENRVVSMKLRVRPQANMDAALDQVGVIVDKFKAASATPAGIALVWTPANSTRSVTFDVLHGEILELPVSMEGQGRSWLMQRPIFTLEMTCKPYWRGTETLSAITTASTPLVSREITGTTGDVPALGRLIVTDSANQGRNDVEWGLEARNYLSTASLIIDSDSMTVLSGTATTRTGAYDPNASGNNVIRGAVMEEIVPICNTGDQTHVGTFRVWGRFYLTKATQNVRLQWRVSEADWTATGGYKANPWASAYTVPAQSGFGFNQWVELDLGLITIPRVTSGTQSWEGFIEAYESPGSVAITSTSDVDVDYLLLVPVDDGYGRARSRFSFRAGPTIAYDKFTSTTSGGALNARVAPLGGTWATSGSTTDFTFGDTIAGLIPSETVLRSTTADTGIPIGRNAVLGSTNYSSQSVSASFMVAATSLTGTAITIGLLGRWVDANNHVNFYLYVDSAGAATVNVAKWIAGTDTIMRSAPVNWPLTNNLNGWFRMHLAIYSNGRFLARYGRLTNGTYDSASMFWESELSSFDSALAAGGTLASGKFGFRDGAAIGAATNRFVDDFHVTTPDEPAPVVFSGEKIEFRHDTVIQEGPSASPYNSEAINYRGKPFVIPPGTSRVAARVRRQLNDLQPVDNVTDSTSVQVGVTPRGLVVPR